MHIVLVCTAKLCPVVL